MSHAIPAIRILDTNPDHHLWNNNGTWWIHYTVHLPDYTKHRVRKSLSTSTAEEARRKRDRIFRRLLEEAGGFGLN